MRAAAWSRAAQDLNQSREIGFDLLRIYLGIGLCVRGALFIAHPDALLAMIARSGGWFWPATIAHYVIAAHLVGGLMLALGLYTRLAAVVQVPILAGAVFITHWSEGLLRGGQSLEFSGLVFFMLIVFAVFGDGPLSLDARLRRQLPATNPTEGDTPARTLPAQAQLSRSNAVYQQVEAEVFADRRGSV
ncbi:MAG TPA: DoxX family protein [Polyangiaceae bacterium]|jgi:uncharacterized membrane protein YphA (DoxX/SURF4 family)|nr:DoxX family protein [Polyangiaceae bacterium]